MAITESAKALEAALRAVTAARAEVAEAQALLGAASKKQAEAIAQAEAVHEELKAAIGAVLPSGPVGRARAS